MIWQVRNYKVGDLLTFINHKRDMHIYIVIGELSGVTIRVKNIVTGKVSRMPPRWFTKIGGEQ